MKLLSVVFLVSLLLGQIGGIQVYPGVVIYIHDIFLAILLAEGFVQYALTGKFAKPKLAGLIGLFIAVAIISLLTNSGRFDLPALEAGSLYLVRWIFYALLYVLVRQTYIKADHWLNGLFVLGVGFGVLGLMQFILYPDLRNLSYLGWDPHFYRLFSTFFDPNFAGIFLVLTILLGTFLWQNKKNRIWLVPAEVVCIVALLLTYSRSSYLAFISGLVALAVCKKQWLIIFGIIIFILAVVYVPRTSGSTLDLLRSDSTFARLGNWQQGVTLISQAPVFGHGFNMLRYVTSDSGSPTSRAAAGLDSSILFVGATTGILGLLAYGYLIFSMVRMGRGNAVYLSCFVALGIHSFFVNSAFYPWVLIWFWMLTGVVERSFDSKTHSG
jgi:hypothetical protein